MKRLVLSLCIFLTVIASAAPLREVRGAWIVTSPGIDWPRGETDPARQQRVLTDILDRLQGANFNTIYFQVQGQGDVLWNSILEPAMADITGDGSKGLRYDVAEWVVDRAHERGLEIYAIINPFDLGTAGEAARYGDNRIHHPIDSLRNLTINHQGHYCLDPGNPDARDFLMSLYTELLTGYDFDGILIDSPLYPAPDINDSQSYSNYNYYGETPENWRVDNLNTFVRSLNDIMIEHRPDMGLQLATSGITPVDENGHQLPEPSIATLLDEGIIDMVVPKLFDRSDYGFTPALEMWTDTPLSSSTIPAITPETATSGYRKAAPDVADQIEHARDDGRLGGIIIYRVSMITDTARPDVAATYNSLRNSTFRYPAHLPVLPRRHDTPTPAPLNPRSERDEYGDYIITWDTPDPDTEGHSPKYYTIYLARDGKVDLTDPRTEIAHRVSGNRYIYPDPLDQGLEFAVTAFDHSNTESAPVFTGVPGIGDLDTRGYIFRYYADNLYIAAPKEIMRVDIYTMWGNPVKNVTTSGYEVSIPCSDMGGGVYVVHTRYGDGSSDVNKFIK